MNEEEKNWQLFVNQAEEEQQKPHPDLFTQRGVGCLVGGVLGPSVLIALLFLAEALHPNESGGSSIMFFLFLLIAVPVGGIIGAVLSPFVVKLISSFAHPKSK